MQRSKNVKREIECGVTARTRSAVGRLVRDNIERAHLQRCALARQRVQRVSRLNLFESRTR